MRAVAICTLLLLTDCAGSVVGDALAGPEAIAAREDAYCRSIGLQFGTPEYANCRMTVSAQRQQAHQAAVLNATTNMQRALETPRLATPRRCTSTRLGNDIITDCQ